MRRTLSLVTRLNVLAIGCSIAIASATISATHAQNAARAVPDLDPANPVTLTVGVPRNFGYLSTLWARNVQVPGVKIEYKYFPNFVDMLTAFNGRQQIGRAHV